MHRRKIWKLSAPCIPGREKSDRKEVHSFNWNGKLCLKNLIKIHNEVKCPRVRKKWWAEIRGSWETSTLKVVSINFPPLENNKNVHSDEVKAMRKLRGNQTMLALFMHSVLVYFAYSFFLLRYKVRSHISMHLFIKLFGKYCCSFILQWYFN